MCWLRRCQSCYGLPHSAMSYAGPAVPATRVSVVSVPSPVSVLGVSPMKSRVIAAVLAVGLLCISSQANAFERIAMILGGGGYGGGCGCDNTCGCEPACGCDRGCHRGCHRGCKQRCGCGLFSHHRGCGCDNACGCDVSCAAPSCAAPSCAAPSCAAPAPTCEAAPSCGCEPACGCDNGCGRHRCHRQRCCKQRCGCGLFSHHRGCGCDNACGCDMAPTCGCGYGK